MKILIICQYFWPESFRINDVAASLQERGHTVTVLTGKPNYPAGEYFPGYSFFGQSRGTYRGVSVVRVPILPRGRRSSLQLLFNYASFVISASLIAPFLNRDNYDVILVFALSPITQVIPALILKMLGRGPVIVWLQDLWPESLSATGAVKARWLIRLVWFATAIMHRNADLNLVSCKGFAGKLRAMGVSPHRIRYLPNYAEDAFGEYIEKPKEESTGPTSNIFKIMFAGNIGEAQDFPTILAAAEFLKSQKHIQWVIVGEGRASGWVEDEVIRRGLQGIFKLAGRYPMEEMPKWFSAADVMLVTLRKDPIFALTLPSKVQSYMAASKPIVAALEGEAALILHKSQCGICVPAGDACGLAKAVLNASHMSPEDLRTLGRNGRAYYDSHFERERLLTQLEEWMQAASPAPLYLAGADR